MDFNSLIDALVNSQDNTNLQMYVNNSALTHTQNEYDCLNYLQTTFKQTLLGFKTADADAANTVNS